MTYQFIEEFLQIVDEDNSAKNECSNRQRERDKSASEIRYSFQKGNTLENYEQSFYWCKTCQSVIHKHPEQEIDDAKYNDTDVRIRKNESEKETHKKNSVKNKSKKLRRKKAKILNELHQSEEQDKKVILQKYCSMDCELKVQLFINPHFNLELSNLIEQECSKHWKELLSILTLAEWNMAANVLDTNDKSNAHYTNEENSKRVNTNVSQINEIKTTINSDINDRHHNKTICQTLFDSEKEVNTNIKQSAFPFKQIANNRVRVQLIVHCMQIRYTGWFNYFAKELRISSHPLYTIPPYMDISDEWSEFVNNLITPSEQAKRLYLLHPETYPIGSVVALPCDEIWKYVSPFKCNTTNNYIAESADYLINDVANFCTKEEEFFDKANYQATSQQDLAVSFPLLSFFVK